MSISPSKPQSGHFSSCEPEILGISICEEHSGHSTVIVSGISLLTMRFLTTFLLAGFFTYPSLELKFKGELLVTGLGEGDELGGGYESKPSLLK